MTVPYNPTNKVFSLIHRLWGQQKTRDEGMGLIFDKLRQLPHWLEKSRGRTCFVIWKWLHELEEWSPISGHDPLWKFSRSTHQREIKSIVPRSGGKNLISFGSWINIFWFRGEGDFGYFWIKSCSSTISCMVVFSYRKVFFLEEDISTMFMQHTEIKTFPKYQNCSIKQWLKSWYTWNITQKGLGGSTVM